MDCQLQWKASDFSDTSGSDLCAVSRMGALNRRLKFRTKALLRISARLRCKHYGNGENRIDKKIEGNFQGYGKWDNPRKAISVVFAPVLRASVQARGVTCRESDHSWRTPSAPSKQYRSGGRVHADLKQS
jgi:hypothetical protein